jgi:serine/threonine protein kinase
VDQATPNKRPAVDPGDDRTEITRPAPEIDDDATQASVIPAPPPMRGRASDFAIVPGTMLGEYQVEAAIGRGGMGTVYLAVHPLIGKRAAIKVLNKDFCSDPYTVERFVDEARVVNQIGHPNIVDIFAFGEMVDGRHYFVMELLRGETLRARLDRGRLDLVEAATVLKQLARALEAAHGKGIIHRDLKPDNIFLVEVPDEPARVKLLDFGIAKLSRETHRIERTATGAMVGTPQYIAPEQAKGHAIDASVDTYALGGIAFELVTGRPPFVADNAMEIVAKHLMELPPQPSQLAPVPPELDALIFRMLAKHAAARPTLAEATAVFERVRTRQSIPAVDDRASVAELAVEEHAVTQPRPAERGRRGVAVLVAAGMVAACVTAYIVVRTLTDDSGTTASIEPAPPVPTPPPPTPPTSPEIQVPADPPPPPVKAADPPPPPKKHEPPEPPKHVAHVEPRPQVKHQTAPAVVEAPVETAKPAATGYLRVNVSGAARWDVIVDNQPHGGVSGLTLPVGPHTVIVQFPNHAPLPYPINIVEGKTAAIDVNPDLLPRGVLGKVPP